MWRICIGIILVVVLALGIHNGIKVNEKYPDPQVIQFKAGEKCEYNDVCMRIKGHETISWKELKQKYPDATQDYVTDDESKVIRITLELTGLEDSRFDLTELAVQNGLTSTQVLYGMTVEKNGTTRIELAKGETKEADMYFLFCKEWFYDKDWENWESTDFYLEILNTYPVRYIFELNLSE